MSVLDAYVEAIIRHIPTKVNTAINLPDVTNKYDLDRSSRISERKSPELAISVRLFKLMFERRWAPQPPE